MKAFLQHLHVASDPETGSALALLLTAAGYEVETDFVDGSTFISAEPGDAEIRVLDGITPEILARQLRERLDDSADDLEFAEMSSEFRKVA